MTATPALRPDTNSAAPTTEPAPDLSPHTSQERETVSETTASPETAPAPRDAVTNPLLPSSDTPESFSHPAEARPDASARSEAPGPVDAATETSKAAVWPLKLIQWPPHTNSQSLIVMQARNGPCSLIVRLPLPNPSDIADDS